MNLVYSLSGGKSLPAWLPEKKRRAIANDPAYKQNVDLIQDFGFPSAAQTITMSGDGRYVIATGTYPPRVRVFDTTELSLKFERYMDAASVATVSLSEDYGKIAFLLDDRHVELHAAYGRHYRTRIPTFGRAMAWHAPTAELLIASGGAETYRLNLEEGRFLAPLTSSAPSASPSSSASAAAASKGASSGDRGGVGVLAVSHVTALIATGSDGGVIDMWDPRDTERPAASVSIPWAANGSGSSGVSSLAFDERSLSMAVGTTDGRALVYDLRKRFPTSTKVHQYGLPVHTVAFHRGSSGSGSSGGIVVSADAKIVKLWSATDVSAWCGCSVHVYTRRM